MNLEKFFTSKRWIIAFVIVCIGGYEWGTQYFRHEESILKNRLIELTQIRKELLSQQESLNLQIQSQSDPAWVELTLMKVFGVIPEGQKKVVFYEH